MAGEALSRRLGRAVDWAGLTLPERVEFARRVEGMVVFSDLAVEDQTLIREAERERARQLR